MKTDNDQNKQNKTKKLPKLSYLGVPNCFRGNGVHANLLRTHSLSQYTLNLKAPSFAGFV